MKKTIVALALFLAVTTAIAVPFAASWSCSVPPCTITPNHKHQWLGGPRRFRDGPFAIPGVPETDCLEWTVNDTCGACKSTFVVGYERKGRRCPPPDKCK